MQWQWRLPAEAVAAPAAAATAAAEAAAGYDEGVGVPGTERVRDGGGVLPLWLFLSFRGNPLR